MTELQLKSERLSQLNDQLRERIEQIEAHLRQRLSTRVETSFSADGKRRLAFGKIDGKWRLIIITILNDTEQDETALGSCDQVTRSEVVSGGHIERLIRDASTQLEGQIADRQYALSKANELIVALTGSQP